jgi:imidazolonepropionase-like amidohydrolase
MVAPIRSLAVAGTLLTGAWSVVVAQLPAVPPQRTAAFVDVTIIPLGGEPPQGVAGLAIRRLAIPGQTVIVRDGRIAAIGPAASTAVPDDALRINGTGKFLMPGLAEMHGHVPGQAALAHATMFLFVANGVTTVRGMQGSAAHIALRGQIDRGEVLGPRFYAAGPQLSGNSAPTPTIADSVVRAQKAAGYDLLKIQEGLSRDSYDAVVAAARTVGIPFGGHVPDAVGLWHALESRQGTIDHLDNFMEAVTAADFPAQHLAARGVGGSTREIDRRIAGAAAAAKRSGTAVVPTMPLWEMLYIPPDSATLAGRAELRYVPRNMVAGWFRTVAGGGRVQGEAARREWRTTRMNILRALHEARVPILLGTDAPQVFSVPGFSIHREMETMVEAGMDPFAVLSSGTRNIAEHFGTLAEAGTIDVGKRADLILLDANPLDSVANVQRRTGVMVHGRWLPESEIQKGLSALAAQYATP